MYRPSVFIIENVNIGPIDTTEIIPPERFNGAPVGEISGTTLVVEMSLETNEFSHCRYSTASGTPYFSMSSTFSPFNFWTVHSVELAVSTSTSYTFYIRCIDDEGNVNIDDYEISFSVPEYPLGEPGDTGDEAGQGDTPSGDNGVGDGTGVPGDVDTDPTDAGTGGGTGSGGGSSGGSGGGSSGSGGSGGGGFTGSGPYQSGDGRVIINGYSFPSSDVVILVDGQRADQVRANNNGAFTSTLDNIASGVYTFGVYALDKNGVKSTTFTTTFTVTGSRGSTLSNVNIMPTIKVAPDPVPLGNSVTFSGYSIPDATLTIENQNDKTSASLKTYTTTSDNSGVWSITVDTTGLSAGTYKVRAKAKQDTGVSTNFSNYTYYGIGENANRPQTSDLNRDGKVNLVDFSILLFWWNSNGGASDPPADINQDGKVSLTDFSIMIFNWTG
jgi:hypothetical protein